MTGGRFGIRRDGSFAGRAKQGEKFVVGDLVFVEIWFLNLVFVRRENVLDKEESSVINVFGLEAGCFQGIRNQGVFDPEAVGSVVGDCHL